LVDEGGIRAAMSATGRPLSGTPLQRALVRSAWVAAALAWGACMTAAAPARESESSAARAAPLKIGIIGAGHIGGTLASLWAKAGHELLVSSRHPDRKSTRLNSSHRTISYAVFCLKKKKKNT